MHIKKVVIPAAGFGTRFLPQTKAMPKEMLPIVDKPVIQYVVEEAVEAGVKDIIIVTGWHKRAIEDHFDNSFELEKRLQEWGKRKLVRKVKKIANLANFIYIRQKGPYGNATPIRCCEHILENEPFLVLWGDDFVLSTPSRTQQMFNAFNKYNSTILCGIKTDNPEDTKRYGFVQGEEIEKGVWRVDKLIEKPGPDRAPSNLAIVSGYLLTSDIFPILDSQKPGTGGEYYLLEALDILASTKNVYAIEIKGGKYYDTGNKLAYIKTVLELSLKNPEINKELKKYLKTISKNF